MNWLERILGKTAATVAVKTSTNAPDDFADLPEMSGSSFLTLKRKRQAIGEDLRAHVYRYDNKTFLITALTRPQSGPTTESGAPVVLPIDCSNEDLGRAVCECLLDYSVVGRIDARNSKLADWAVYNASGAKSGKSFESKCLYASIVSGKFFLDIEANPYRRLDDGFCVKGSARPEHEIVGATLRRTLRAVDALWEKGLI